PPHANAVPRPHEAEQPAVAVVPEDGRAPEAGDVGSPVHVATGDRAPAGAVAVLVDRTDGAARAAVLIAMITLETAPAVALAAMRVRGLLVDLLPRVLPDVADPEVARGAVEGEPPGIPKSVRPDLGANASPADERVGRRNGVWMRAGRCR